MLKKSFLHIPGIGSGTEQKLWAKGLHDWKSCLENPQELGSKNRDKVFRWIEESQRALDCRDPGFFADRLPAHQLWRIYPEFRHSCLFFDIETNGRSSDINHVTTIATFDGQEVRTFVYDQNLNEFPDYLNSFDLIVSYSGKCFDLPFLRREFGSLNPPAGHIDLRYVLAQLGYRGGLKACEKALGLARPDELQGVDGFLAVLLWGEHLRATSSALESLLCYNVHDAINLQWLLQLAYNLAIARLPIEVEPLELEPLPTVEFQADDELIRSLLQ